MSFTIAAVLRKPNRLGKYPIYLRLSVAGLNAVYKKVGLPPVSKKDWDQRKGLLKTSADGSVQLNNKLQIIIEKAHLYILEQGCFSDNPAILLQVAIEGDKSGQPKNPLHRNFFEVADEYLRIRRERLQFKNAENRLSQVNNLRKFKKMILLTEIDKSFIDKIVKHQLQEQGLSQNVVYRNIKTYGSIYESAIEDTNLHYNPFRKYKISPGKRKVPVVPTIDDINSLISIRPSLTKKQRTGLDIYLTQFFLRGNRVGDVLMLRNDQVKADYILFQEDKTGVWKQCNIHPVLAEILSDYDNPVYVFPYYTHENDPKLSDKENYDIHRNQISKKTSLVNKYVKLACQKAGIEKKLTSHTARHGFATIAVQRTGSLRDVQAALGHGRFSTTESYAHDLKRADYSELERKVFEGIKIG